MPKIVSVFKLFSVEVVLVIWVEPWYMSFTQLKHQNSVHYLKSVRIQSFSGPYVPAFGLNTKIYRVNLCIQSKCGKIPIRKTPNTNTFYAVGVFLFLTLDREIWEYNFLKSGMLQLLLIRQVHGSSRTSPENHE